MRLLLDTHVALWFIVDDPRMATVARDTILDSANEVAVSVASLWEIAIKYPLARQGRGRMPISASAARDEFRDAGFRILGITEEHALAVEKLPLFHTDPFDRLIVAQALTEPLRLLTHDTNVAAYSDTIIAV